MNTFDLASMQRKNSNAMRLLGLLIHIKLFEPHTKSPIRSEINSRLGRVPLSNESKSFNAWVDQIKRKLSSSITEGSRDKFDTIEFAQPAGLTVTWEGETLTSELLLSKCKITAPPETPAFDFEEAACFKAVSALSKSEVAFRTSNHHDAIAKSTEALSSFGNTSSGSINSPRWVQCLTYIHQLRTYRRLENWRAIDRTLENAREMLKKWRDEDEHAMLDGLIHIHLAWRKYDQLVSKPKRDLADVQKIEQLLNSASAQRGAKVNNYLAFEQSNLYSLVKRRLAESLKTNDAPEQDIEQAELQALTLNFEAIKFAAMSSDLTALSNACGNRTPILHAMLRRKKNSLEEQWQNSLLWLVLGWEIGEKAALGGDDLWTPIYLLTTYRFSESADNPSKWKRMMKGSAQVSGWFSNRQPSEHVIDTAMKMSGKILEKVLAASKKEQSSFARQLIMLAGELGGAGFKSYPFAAPPYRKVFSKLADVIAQIPEETKKKIQDFDEKERFFLKWKNENAST